VVWRADCSLGLLKNPSLLRANEYFLQLALQLQFSGKGGPPCWDGLGCIGGEDITPS